ncbi:MAG: DUF3604 domain-containing protein, partial [Hyphomonadaceae bacterium]
DAYFGDLHIHTRNSVDAYMFGARVTPEDAYRFARGEAISHPGGYDIQLAGPPLDFLAVTDHAEYLGIMPAMADPESYLSKHPIAVAMFTAENRAEILAAFRILSASMISGEPIDEINDQELINSVWADTIAAAEAYYEPGRMTTFAGFEYSVGVDLDRDIDTPDIATLHRNVIFKGEAPDQVFSALDSIDSEDLWDWMDDLRVGGVEALAIPHNSNISSGLAFDLKRFSGASMDATYAEQRMRNEPLVEITQVKGTSETHPLLSPNDEWANFELYEVLIPSHVKGQVEGSYVREALQNGLRLQEGRDFNPFHFGFAGASDTHVGGGSFDERGYWSKLGRNDAHAEQRGSVPPDGAESWEGVELDPRAQNWFAKWSASGLTGVWAEVNTREAIYAALRRKETFATSGTRIRVRFFAGLDFEDGLIESPNLISDAYRRGVPMGGDLTSNDVSPAFVAWAMRDPRGAPLQRLQIIKGWTEAEETHESVYDIACSNGLEPDPEIHRCPENGARVDLSDCSILTDAGASELRTMWRDPDFDAAQHAFYYVRVLENPTCRWSTWDAIEAGTPPNPAMPAVLQERAWSSPIWLSPAGE